MKGQGKIIALALGTAALTSCMPKDEPVSSKSAIVHRSLDAPAASEPLLSTQPSPKPSASPSQQPSPAPTTANLLYQSDFETAASLGAPVFQAAEANRGKIVLSTEQARRGNSSVKVMLDQGEPLVSGSQRNELKPAETLAPKSERWYGLSIFLPVSFVVDPVPESIFQWHQIPNFKQGEDWGLRTSDGGVRQTPMHVGTSNGRWYLQHCYSSVPNDFRSPAICRKTDLGAYQTGVWTDWVVHARFSYDDGILEVWKNGQLVHTKIGQTYYNDESGPYMKFGIYKWGWTGDYGSTTRQRTIYFDEFRIGGPKSSYSEVAPRR